jgi:hypothetical protein
MVRNLPSGTRISNPINIELYINKTIWMLRYKEYGGV